MVPATSRYQVGEAVLPALLDITDPDAVAAAAELVSGEVGERGLDGLVNNAGIAVAAPLEFLPPDELRRQLEVNVVGQHAVTQALLPMLRRGRGRIINLGSIGDRIVAPMTGPYHVSKFALRAWNGRYPDSAARSPERPGHSKRRYRSGVRGGFAGGPAGL